MIIRILYGDFSTWEGTLDTFEESPEHPDGLQWLVLFRPCGHIVRFTGADYFGVKKTDLGWVVAKKAPYRPVTSLFWITRENKSEVSDKPGDFPLDGFDTRLGKWMSNDDYRKSYEIIKEWRISPM